MCIRDSINKMDREARDPFELMENIEEILGIKTYPMNWPISCGKDFKGVYDRNAKRVLAFESDGRANGVKMVDEVEAELGDARLDAAQSSLLRDGSVPVREQALATRLQTRIQDEAAAAMRNAQSLYNRANMEQYMGRANARAQKTAAAGTLLSGFAQGGNALLKW